MIQPTFTQWNVKNKRIFIRADLNVPMVNGKITNDFRLTSILPTINFILNQQASIVLATHLGQPINNEPELSTKILIPWFCQQGYSIEFIKDFKTIAHSKIIPKHILLIENLRFFPGEKAGDPFFAKQLASTADYYINDAFGVIHRNDCSVTLLPYEFPENRRSIGFLMEKELHELSILKENPPRPFIAILGGKKIKDKISLIESLLHKIDTLAICPALCFSFLKSLKEPIGQSLIDDSILQVCKKIILKAEALGVKCLFPIDYQVSYNTVKEPFSIISASQFPPTAIGISIGPKTVTLLTTEINNAKTIFLNCAMGFADKPITQESTKDIINAMALSSAKTIIAGGDSVDIALNTPTHHRITHLSTGGGAALAYLSSAVLPGLTPFKEL